MKALFENVPRGTEISFAYRIFRRTRFPFNWHFHPEIELTLIRRGRGRRFVGDNIEPFAEGDLVLIGENLPHTWMSDADERATSESIVIQFRREFLGREFFERVPEVANARRLLERAARGLRFSGSARSRTAATMSRMEHRSPLERLTDVLGILGDLAGERSAAPLSSASFQPSPQQLDRKRVHAVCDFLNREFARPITLDEAAAVAKLSASGFSRFFFGATGKTFTGYLTELRIGRACQLLLQTDKNIATIAYDAGFENLSNFNRRFQKVKRMTPREFRKAYAVGV